MAFQICQKMHESTLNGFVEFFMQKPTLFTIYGRKYSQIAEITDKGIISKDIWLVLILAIQRVMEKKEINWKHHFWFDVARHTHLT